MRATDQDYNGDAAQQKQYWLDLVKGWHLPLYQRLVEAAQPSSILKSHIYQRYDMAQSL